VLGASLLACGVALASSPSVAKPGQGDRIAVEPRNEVLELVWSDTEERLKGSIQPDPPREGQPLKVLLHVGSFQGEEFQGPLTVTLRRTGETLGETKLVTRGAVNWVAEFTPEEAGSYTLSVAFRTTRHKVLNADFNVAPSQVPRFILYGLVGLAAAAMLAFGIRSLVRPEKPPEVHPVLAELKAAESAPTPTSAQVSPPPSSPTGSPADPQGPAEAVAESSTGSTPDKPPTL
jgi:hypothetical protein